MRLLERISEVGIDERGHGGSAPRQRFLYGARLSARTGPTLPLPVAGMSIALLRLPGECSANSLKRDIAAQGVLPAGNDATAFMPWLVGEHHQLARFRLDDKNVKSGLATGVSVVQIQQYRQERPLGRGLLRGEIHVPAELLVRSVLVTAEALVELDWYILAQ